MHPTRSQASVQDASLGVMTSICHALRNILDNLKESGTGYLCLGISFPPSLQFGQEWLFFVGACVKTR